VNPGTVGSVFSWVDLSVVTGDGKARMFIQQVFFEPVTHKISKLGAFIPNDNLPDPFPAPTLIRAGGARFDLSPPPPPIDGSGQPPAKSNSKTTDPRHM
jgi:hypothetical protein